MAFSQKHCSIIFSKVHHFIPNDKNKTRNRNNFFLKFYLLKNSWKTNRIQENLNVSLDIISTTPMKIVLN